MTSSARKLALTAHIASSAGWLGAVAAFLPLAVVALTNTDERAVRSAYYAMAAIGRLIIVPLSLLSLLTGLLVSLGGAWGLFRHYWVAAKLLINVVSIIILLKYMQTLDRLAALAANSGGGLEALRDPSSIFHSSLALLALLTATTLSVYKPWGLTPYGYRMRQEQDAGEQDTAAAKLRRLPTSAALVAIALIALGLLLRLAGHGPGRH